MKTKKLNLIKLKSVVQLIEVAQVKNVLGGQKEINVNISDTKKCLGYGGLNWTE